jgi:hypothetical protein
MLDWRRVAFGRWRSGSYVITRVSRLDMGIWFQLHGRGTFLGDFHRLAHAQAAAEKTQENAKSSTEPA